jgi:hypothetical protein
MIEPSKKRHGGSDDASASGLACVRGRAVHARRRFDREDADGVVASSGWCW